MKQTFYLLLLLPCFSLFGQSSDFEDAPIIQNTNSFFPIQLIKDELLNVYLDGEAINPFNFSKEISNYCTVHEKELRLINDKVSFNLLVNVDEDLKYKDILFFHWAVNHTIADSIVIVVSNENDTIKGITRYNHDFFEESMIYLEKKYKNRQAKYELLTNTTWNNATPKEETPDTESPEFALPPPPPPPPPSMSISYVYKEIRELAPIFITLDTKGKIKIEGNEVERSNLETVLKNIIQEIKDGNRANTTLHDFNADKDVDLFAYLTVEEDVLVKDYLKLKQQIINICLEASIHPLIEESFPYETDLIRKTLND